MKQTGCIASCDDQPFQLILRNRFPGKEIPTRWQFIRQENNVTIWKQRLLWPTNFFSQIIVLFWPVELPPWRAGLFHYHVSHRTLTSHTWKITKITYLDTGLLTLIKLMAVFSARTQICTCQPRGLFHNRLGDTATTLIKWLSEITTRWQAFPERHSSHSRILLFWIPKYLYENGWVNDHSPPLNLTSRWWLPKSTMKCTHFLQLYISVVAKSPTKYRCI